MAVVNFGSLNIDLVYRVPHIAAPGETISSSAFETFAGGKGANQSVALAKAGAAVRHCGCIGSDGRWLREKLAAAGVDVTHIEELPDHPTGHALIQVDDHGQNAIVIFPGANHQFSIELVERALADVQPGDVVLLQNEINRAPQIMQAAVEAGAKVWLNPAPFTLEVHEYPLDLVDCLIVNETEAEALTGASTQNDRLHEMLAARSRDGQMVVLTRGAAGATCWQEGRRIDVAAPVVQARDTTAAGDTFIGYLLAAVVAGHEMQEAMRRACVAAAICVTRAGAMDAIPTYDEVEARL